MRFMMQMQAITRDHVIELARTMPLDKLTEWYKYGIFIQTQPEIIATDNLTLEEEFDLWDQASDDAWFAIEEAIGETL